MPERRRRERRRRTRRGAGDDSNIFGQIAGGPVGLAGNLFGDVRDAVIGLPMGLIELAKNPIGASKNIGTAIWQTWSPLFEGDFGEFGQQLYDHPLAPILDVMSVFTLGAGTAARSASALSKVGAGGARTAKVAALRGPKTPRPLTDPTGKRATLEWHPSERAGRAAIQMFRESVEPHMPGWYQKPVQRLRYERAHAVEIAGRQAAKTLVLSQMLEAGRLLSDAITAPIQRARIMAHTHLNMLRHAYKVDYDEAVRLGANQRRGHYNFVTAPEKVNRGYDKQLDALRKKEARFDKVREQNAELSHELPKIEKELESANVELARMRQESYIVATPAGRRSVPTEKQSMEQIAGPLNDATRHVADLEERLTLARQAKGHHEHAISEMVNLKTQRMNLEKRSHTEFYEKYSYSAEAFEKGARDLGRWGTTYQVTRAARTKDGQFYVVPKHDAANVGLEAANSHAFVRLLYHKPTILWKRLMIGYTPRAVTNNAVGNWTIYALREGPTYESARAVWDAIEYQYGTRKAAQSFADGTPWKGNRAWVQRNFGDVLGNVFGEELMRDALGARGRLRAAGRKGIYPVVHTVADYPVRVASLFRYLRSHPDVRRLMKEEGLKFDRAVQRALRKKPQLRDMAAEHVRRTAGDYITMTTVGQHVRNIVPFYLWYRHIAKTSINMAADTPARLALMSRVSALGIEKTKDILGEIPEFLEGAIPLSVLGFDEDERGRKNVMLTMSLNPFASIGELSTLAQALTTGGGARGLGGGLIGVNPFLTGIVEAASGRSLLSGGQIDTTGGVVPTVFTRTAKGLPQYRVTEALLQEDTRESDAGNKLLFVRDDRGPLTSLFGVPLRNMSEESAQRLAQLEADEQGEKVSNRRRRRRRRRR